MSCLPALCSASLVSCTSTYLTTHASVVRESFRSCYLHVLPACDTLAYHVNAYPDGAITGPYSGTGAIL
jgi:hypothetical protein